MVPKQQAESFGQSLVRTDGLWRLLFCDPMDQALPEADGCEDLGRLEEKYSYRLVIYIYIISYIYHIIYIYDILATNYRTSPCYKNG